MPRLPTLRIFFASFVFSSIRPLLAVSRVYNHDQMLSDVGTKLGITSIVVKDEIAMVKQRLSVDSVNFTDCQNQKQASMESEASKN